MKKFIMILICTSMLGFLSCNKDEDENIPDFDPATVIPEDYLNMIKQSMPLYIVEAPCVRCHIIFDAEVLHSMSGKYKEGDKLGKQKKKHSRKI